jgi:hypothetical protein
MNTGQARTKLMRLLNNLRIAFLLPFILIVWFTEWVDPRLWKYWNMKSMENWRWFRWRWHAYAIAAIGWVIVAATVWFGAHPLLRLRSRSSLQPDNRCILVDLEDGGQIEQFGPGRFLGYLTSALYRPVGKKERALDLSLQAASENRNWQFNPQDSAFKGLCLSAALRGKEGCEKIICQAN